MGNKVLKSNCAHLLARPKEDSKDIDEVLGMQMLTEDTRKKLEELKALRAKMRDGQLDPDELKALVAGERALQRIQRKNKNRGYNSEGEDDILDQNGLPLRRPDGKLIVRQPVRSVLDDQAIVAVTVNGVVSRDQKGDPVLEVVPRDEIPVDVLAKMDDSPYSYYYKMNQWI